MGSVHARGDTFLTFGLKALTETNTSRLATGLDINFDLKNFIKAKYARLPPTILFECPH
jgi:hypothetical protein